MKTKVKVETIVQPMYKVHLSTKFGTKWFFCTANSIEEAQKLAQNKFSDCTVGNAFECVDNWSIISS